MCWFNDCGKVANREELESTKRMLSKAEKRIDDWRNLWLEARREMADLRKPQWIDVQHALPKDGQRVNVVAYIGAYGVRKITIADYCSCTGFTHPFASTSPDYKYLTVLHWCPIPEMIEKI